MAGNPEHPEPELICARCDALPADDRKVRRDKAMARMLADPSKRPVDDLIANDTTP
ncbi:MAG: hypothetical protein ABIR79_14310 [Candidatus Binatia bacterium]